MFCPACACELADDAKFCVKCGAVVEIAANPAGDAAEGVGSSVVVAETPPAIIPATILPATAPPYANFVMQVLGLALCLSIVAFNAADNLAHGYWRVWIVAVGACIAAVALMLRLPSTWRRIEAGGDSDEHQKKLLRLSLIFVILFVATATIVGAAIGKSGRETGQLVADFKEMGELGSRISQARNAAESTVPANIEMYKDIEGDVQAFDAVLHRLHAELPVYDDKFPGEHDTTAKSMDSIEVGLKRASLLKQQIVVARDIEALSPDPRWQAWKDRMQPLLDAEAGLDKN
jgi:hypothetical protein